ncbi:MAG: UvrD-helicase domain-containing protein, partial [Pseudomonadota bacterium]
CGVLPYPSSMYPNPSTQTLVLTEEQGAVVHHDCGHALVAAVPGSGKTATLIERVVALVGQGVRPSRILVLMFNEAVQKQFVARLRQRLPGADVRVHTFHAFGQRLLRALTARSLAPGAELCTAEWFWLDLAKCALTGLAGCDSGDTDQASRFLACVDRWKADLLTPAAVAALDSPDAAAFGRAYALFEEARERQRVRSFSDLLYDPMRVLGERPEWATIFRDVMSHVIIDEFQDINAAQFALLRVLVGQRTQLLAVGDDDQSIYGWRGSRPSFMLEAFAQAFPGARRYVLSQTFRYGPRLAATANALIERNPNRIPKRSHATATAPDTDVLVHLTATPEAEIAAAVERFG